MKRDTATSFEALNTAVAVPPALSALYACFKHGKRSVSGGAKSIEKPFETSPLEPDENGYLEYCVCQYVVFGSCPKDFTHRIGDVTFGRSDCHPNTGIDEEHFVLDFYPIRLPFEEPESEDIDL